MEHVGVSALKEHLTIGKKIIFEKHYQNLSATDGKNPRVDTDIQGIFTCLFSDWYEERYFQWFTAVTREKQGMKFRNSGSLFFHNVNLPTSAWIN